MTDLERAKSILNEGHTCVLVKNDEVIIYDKTGIAPMMDVLANKINVNDFSVADKIVGKAVAMLMALAKVKNVYAEVISYGAIKVLEENGISYSYKVLTDKIINRSGTDICPMEKTVANIEDLYKAYEALKLKFESLIK